MNPSHITYQSFGTGRPIYFIHGNGLDANSMSYFYESKEIEYLNCRRIYINIPGMGKSEIHPNTKNSDDILKELLLFIEEDSHGQKIKLCGHSYGGYLALGIAYKLKTKVESLFLTCPVIKAIHEDRQLSSHINIKQQSVRALINKEYYDDFLSMNVIINPNTWYDYQKSIIPAITNGMNNFWKNIKDTDYRFTFEDELRQYQNFKGLILVGEYDQIVGIQDQNNLAKHNTNLTVKTIKYAGHNLLIDQKSTVITYFSKFISQ